MKKQSKNILLITFLLLLTLAIVVLSAYGADPLFILALSYFLTFCCVLIVIIVFIKNRNFKAQFLVSVLNIVLLFSIGYTSWPLKLSFTYCKDEFESILSKIEENGSKEITADIGMFKILKAERKGPLNVLWVDDSVDGGAAFVKGRNSTYYWSIWSSVRLSNEWSYIVFD